MEDRQVDLPVANDIHSPLDAQAEGLRAIVSVAGEHALPHPFHRLAGTGQAAQHFRADRDDLMPRHTAQDAFIAVVTAVVFAVFAQ